ASRSVIIALRETKPPRADSSRPFDPEKRSQPPLRQPGPAHRVFWHIPCTTLSPIIRRPARERSPLAEREDSFPKCSPGYHAIGKRGHDETANDCSVGEHGSPD